MKIEIIKCLQDNFSYYLYDERKNISCIVDPGEYKPIVNYLNKNDKKLDYILNTHHHHDHVGANLELKKKYGAKIIGYIGDKDRIPGIDITVKDRETWKNKNLRFKVYHVPGHTSGHICFHFFDHNFLFTGDTLFSLGCGRIFEGTYQEMYNSLEIIKTFPKNTKIFCGHEYTLKNSIFCLEMDKENIKLKNKIISIKKKIKNGNPTIPSLLGEELETNVFLKCKNLENFSKLRELKDNF